MADDPVNTSWDDAVPVLDGEAMSSDAPLLRKGKASQLSTETLKGRSHVTDSGKLAARLYIFLPALFLTVTLIGGLRLSSPDNAFVFAAPALICLVFAAAVIGSFFRGGMVSLNGWFSDSFSGLHDAANAAVLISLFAATTQLFNSVMPESGLPFWVVSFCFAWSLWNNFFTGFDNKRLLKSLAALFVFAFFAKYILLAALTAPAGGGWLKSMVENPGKETLTWLLDLPRYSPGTGYLQFFCLVFYLIGLYLLPRTTEAIE